MYGLDFQGGFTKKNQGGQALKHLSTTCGSLQVEGYYSDSPVGDVLTVAHTREENYLSFPYQFLEEATRLIGGVSVTVETNSLCCDPRNTWSEWLLSSVHVFQPSVVSCKIGIRSMLF